MSVARFVTCLLLAACAHAATAADLMGRYGPPVMQRFVAGHGIVVSVEYNGDGHVATVEIAPVGSVRGRTNDEAVDPVAVSELLDSLIPDQMRIGILSGFECPSRGQPTRICGFTQTDQGVTLHRVHIESESGRKDLLSTITSKTGLPQTAITAAARGRAKVGSGQLLRCRLGRPCAQATMCWITPSS